MAPARILALLAATALAVGACSAAAATTPPTAGPSGASGSPDQSAQPSQAPAGAGLVLRATLEGGFISPSAIRTRLPIVSVYADGRILSEGLTPAIYPGPLVPSIVVRSVGPAGAAGILKAASDAGLAGADGSYGPGPVPDGATTVITVIHNGKQTVSTFNSLPVLQIQPGSGVTDQQVLTAAAQLLARLTSNDTFGGKAGADGTYTPLGFQLFVRPGAPELSDPNLARPPVSWPLSTPLASFGKVDTLGTDGARVGVVVGADAATIGPILASATQITPFLSGGTQWTIVVKPLLPDEVAALGG
jgi:hypothetical protein